MFETASQKALSKIFSGRKNHISALRTKTWLHALLKGNQISANEFQRIISNGAESSNIVNKWMKGENCIQLSTVDRIAKKYYKNSDRVYKLPVFDLLNPKQYNRKELHKIVYPYLGDDGNGPFWRFPPTQNGEHLGRTTPVPFIHDHNTLFARGDIYGFIGLLFLIRLAEIENEGMEHIKYLSFAYRSFPSFAKHYYFSDFWPEYLKSLFLVQELMATSSTFLRPDFDIIEKQIISEDHDPLEMFLSNRLTGDIDSPKAPFHISNIDDFF